MRTLLLFRGAPGCGKSTFIEQHGLKPYTLSADDIRLLVSSPLMTRHGNMTFNQDNDTFVWRMLMQMLEKRMENGEFTVIDATNSKTSEMNKYKELCNTYKYRIYCIDMTDLPIEDCKARNVQREPLKRVPEEAIDKMYARFATQKIPTGITVLRPDELDRIWMHPIDLSQYKKIHHIGDIHGSMHPVSEYIRESFFGFNYDQPEYWRTEKWLNTNDLADERWADVVGYDGTYQISSFGRLRTLSKNKKRIYIYRVDQRGYLYANLSRHSKKQTFKVHQLVWDAFGSEKCDEINHIDGFKPNNNIKNLEASNRLLNETHCWETGLKHGRAVMQFDMDHNFIQEYSSIKQACEALGLLASTNIIHCCNHDIASSHGFIWEYAKEIPGNRSGKAIGVEQYTVDGTFVAEYASIKEAERTVGVQTIRDALLSETRTAGGFLWKAKDLDYQKSDHVDIRLDPKYLSRLICPDELYIFLGDYIDRGIENVEVLKYLLGIYQKPNVLLLEGNHERWLWTWANDATAKSKEFELGTRPQLDASDIDKRDIRKLYRKFAQCAYYTYHGKTVLVTHGGLSRMPGNLTLISTRQLIHGAGNYNDCDYIADRFHKISPEVLQIHAHRNTKALPFQTYDNVVNLEGGVEFGRHLRCAQLLPSGELKFFALVNHIFTEPEVLTEPEKLADKESVGDTIMKLRNCKFVSERQYGDISSFNFTRTAFEDRVWNDLTIRARGLYINIPKQKVVARAYDKFFRVNERPETKLDILQYKLQFPVTAYVKENGFLGLVSYNEQADDLFITTKSSPDGDYAMWFRNLLTSTLSESQLDRLKVLAKELDSTFVFECVDMVHDPHVIEYPGSRLFLLDIVKNDMKFQKQPYEQLTQYASEIGITPKEKACVIENWQDFFDWYYEVMGEDYLYRGRHIEGFVVEDAAGYMIKLKLAYYNFWKFMRGISAEVLRRGYVDKKRLSSFTTPLANHYYAWIKTQFTPGGSEGVPRDICSLRKMFTESDEGKPFAAEC